MRPVIVLVALLLGGVGESQNAASLTPELRFLWEVPATEKTRYAVVALPDGSGRVYVASEGELTTLDAADGHVLWRADLNGTDEIYGVVADELGVYVTTAARDIFALDPAGLSEWRVSGREERHGALLFLASESLLLAHWSLGDLVAYDRSNGAEMWRTPLVATASSFDIAGGVLVFNGQESGAARISITRGIDLYSGAELWSRGRSRPLRVDEDEAVLYDPGYPGLSDPEEVRITVLRPQDGKALSERAFDVLPRPDTSPAVMLEGKMLVIGRRDNIETFSRTADGHTRVTFSCCYLRELLVTNLREESPLRSVVDEFSATAVWLATSWPYALVGPGDAAGPLLRVDLRSGDSLPLGEVADEIDTLTTDGATVAFVTEAGELVWLDLHSGEEARLNLGPDALDGRGALEMELTDTRLVLLTQGHLRAFEVAHR